MDIEGEVGSPHDGGEYRLCYRQGRYGTPVLLELACCFTLRGISIIIDFNARGRG